MATSPRDAMVRDSDLPNSSGNVLNEARSPQSVPTLGSSAIPGGDPGRMLSARAELPSAMGRITDDLRDAKAEVALLEHEKASA